MPWDECRKDASRNDLPLKPDGKRWNANTLYAPEDCDTLIEVMSKGGSYKQVAKAIGVTTMTLQRWAKNHPEFGEAYEYGRDLAQAWWEEAAQRNLETTREKDGPIDSFNDRVFLYTMRARFRQSDREMPALLNIDKDTTLNQIDEIIKRIHKEDI